jgi:hypothetical protein
MVDDRGDSFGRILAPLTDKTSSAYLRGMILAFWSQEACDGPGTPSAAPASLASQ